MLIINQMEERIFWTKELIKKDVKRFLTYSEWVKARKSFRAAERLGVVKEVSKHLIKSNKFGSPSEPFWTRERIMATIKLCKDRKEFRKNKRCYAAAARLGILNEKNLFEHFKKTKISTKWSSEEVVFNDAKQHHSRSEWALNNKPAYEAAKKLGIFYKCTRHMKRLASSWYRCIYTIEVKNQKLVYVGLTYDLKRRIDAHIKSKRFRELKSKFGDDCLEIKQISKFVEVHEAVKLERQCLLSYKKLGYKILNVAKTGALGGNKKINIIK